jgi:hypothetical protein
MLIANCADAEVVCKSIYLAAALYAQGLRLVTVSVEQGRGAHFIFSNESGLADEAVRSYFNRSMPLPPKDIFEALGQLKQEASAAAGKPPREAVRHS